MIFDATRPFERLRMVLALLVARQAVRARFRHLIAAVIPLFIATAPSTAMAQRATHSVLERSTPRRHK
jgi:hypothetical protein